MDVSEVPLRGSKCHGVSPTVSRDAAKIRPSDAWASEMKRGGQGEKREVCLRVCVFACAPLLPYPTFFAGSLEGETLRGVAPWAGVVPHGVLSRYARLAVKHTRGVVLRD